MTLFRPCIDLHQGKVKQIVGSSLRDDGSAPKENFVSEHDAAWFAQLYQADKVKGAHVIMLGKGNEEAAEQALQAYPMGLQVGGGIHSDNAEHYLSLGASHVIVTSFLFDQEGKFQQARLEDLVKRIGRERLVIDLSCKTTERGWVVAMNRWQTLTDLELNASTMEFLASYADEFLIHAVDIEGKCEGIDEKLVARLSEWSPIPVTYAGGARSVNDLWRVDELSSGKVDVTIGSALDIFGGKLVRYRDCIAFNQRQ